MINCSHVGYSCYLIQGKDPRNYFFMVQFGVHKFLYKNFDSNFGFNFFYQCSLYIKEIIISKPRDIYRVHITSSLQKVITFYDYFS